MVLELARRGVGGDTVALDPGGFWSDRELVVFGATLRPTIGWGRRDLVTVPKQAARAMELFPDAVLHWFEGCGHFPQWDAPHEATRLILESTD